MIETIFNNYCDLETAQKIVDYATVGEMWKHSVKEYGNDVAILDNGKSYTYKEIDKDIALLRGVLKARGILKGDYVGVYMENSYDFIRSYLALTTYGAVAVLMPAHLDEMTVFGCTIKYGMTALIYNEASAANLGIIKAKKPGFILIAADEKADKPEPMGKVKNADPCAVLFTGGTTGRSKGALLSHRAIMTGTRNGCYGVKEVFGQRYYLVLPLTHVFGLIRNLMTAMYTGSQLFVCRNRKDMFKEMMMFRPTVLVFVPALAEMALNLSKQFGRNMLGDSVKYIICGAATVPPYLNKEYQKLGVSLLAGYGLTESANLVSGNPETAKNPTSVGFLYPGIETKVVGGELWLKGPNMMDGYVGEEGANEAAYEDGWFKTGDLVRFDDDGFLYIVGRIKELIVLPNGENISPAEYETKFNALEIIQDSLIYEAVEDGEHILVLEVYPRPAELAKLEGDKEACIREQLNEVNKSLPPFARVSKIIIRETDFKRSPAMKILRNQQ